MSAKIGQNEPLCIVQASCDYPDASIAQLAPELDARDELRRFRGQFLFPRTPSAARIRRGSDPSVYLCGNSLGLQCLKVGTYVREELEKWSTLGVEGHFCANRPWVTIDEICLEPMARIVGASVEEVALMNSLTVNLQLLLVSFYRPDATRHKILIEGKAFPSDTHAVSSQIRMKGRSVQESLVQLYPRDGEETLRTEDIEAAIAEHGESLALVLLSGVQYYTGQAFDLQRVAKAAHAVGSLVGYDLAHAVGNVTLRLHEWDVDFACWCTYKYLNSGPGGIGGAFVHARHHAAAAAGEIPRLEGWWGHRKEDRFKMEDEFVSSPGAFGWQMSNPCVLPMVTLAASLELFDEATMPRLRMKSEALTRYLELMLLSELPPGRCTIITPGFERKQERGCQLSLVFDVPVKRVYDRLALEGVVIDMREPNVLRVAPAPLYNSFEDVRGFVETLRIILNECDEST